MNDNESFYFFEELDISHFYKTLKQLISPFSGGFDLTYYSEDTHMGLRSCQWVVDVADKIAAHVENKDEIFTFWVLRGISNGDCLHFICG